MGHRYSRPAMGADDRVLLLRSVPLLQDVGVEHLYFLATLARTRRLRPGATVYRLGDQARDLYVLSQGRIRIVQPSSSSSSSTTTISSSSVADHRDNTSNSNSNSDSSGGGSNENISGEMAVEQVAPYLFGEVTFIRPDCRRDSRVECVSESTFLVLSYALFHRHMRTRQGLWMTDIHTRLEIATHHQLANNLQSVSFFSQLTSSQLHFLGKLFTYEWRNLGEVICTEGQEGDAFYVVASGSLNVITSASKTSVSVEERMNHHTASAAALTVSAAGGNSSSNGNNSSSSNNNSNINNKSSTTKSSATAKRAAAAAIDAIRLGSITTGGYFGEIALMNNTPRTATIVAAEVCVLLRLSRQDFERFLLVTPSIRSRLETYIMQRSAYRLRQLNAPLLSHLSDRDLQLLSELSKLRTLSADTDVYRSEDTGSSLFFVASGQVSVESTEEERAGTRFVEVGEHFGEVSIVLDGPRNESARTVTACMLLEVQRETFEKICLQSKEAIGDFRIRVLGQRVQLEHIIQHPMGYRLLKEFAEHEFALENFLFLDQTATFKRITDDKERLHLAKQICAEFIGDGTKHQINITGAGATEIKSAIQANYVSSWLFDRAEAELRDVLSRDLLPRFKRSSHFDQLLARVQFTK